MADPHEGLDERGMIRTGVKIDRVPDSFRRVLTSAVDAIRAGGPATSAYAYGSVATGQATSPASDVDILTIGVDREVATRIATEQSRQFAELCRSVDIAASSPEDFVGDSDEAYGARVFLHHYCVHLAGPDRDTATQGFPGDRRAARGFNGDIARHHARWRHISATTDPVELGRRVGRKTLLAVAGLVSVHDSSWTTDRRRAAHRWSDLHPSHEPGLAELLAWAEGTERAAAGAVDRSLDGIVASIVEQFAADIGLWTTSTT